MLVMWCSSRTIFRCAWSTGSSSAVGGLRFLSPLMPVRAFMRALCGARLLPSKVMHGAILADILRKPWVAFSFGRQCAEDKWQDWFWRSIYL